VPASESADSLRADTSRPPPTKITPATATATATTTATTSCGYRGTTDPV
jgi:hypothetical protein